MKSKTHELAAARRKKRLALQEKNKIRLAARRFARNPRKLAKAPDPSTTAAEMALRQYTKRHARRLAELLEFWLKRYEPEADPANLNLLVLVRRAMAVVRRDIHTAPARQLATKIYKSTFVASQEIANRQLSPVTGGIPLYKDKPAIRQDADRSAEFIRRNVGLITSIPAQMLDQVERVVVQGIARGQHVEPLRKAVQERFRVAESRAELIARDQVLKLNAQLAEDRAKEQGVETYVWRCSGGPNGDGRVRPMHLELEGTRHRFDSPPVTNEQGDTNNPGEDFQCRCTAEPDVSALLDSLLGDV